VEPDRTISDFGTAGVATNEDPNGWGSAMLVRGGSVLVSHVSQDAIVVTRYLQD
jgi:hypothetical protein